MMLQGMLPKMPCNTKMLKDGIVRKRSTAMSSCPTVVQAPVLELSGFSDFLGGSTMHLAKIAATAYVRTPVTKNRTRQPASRAMKMFATLPPISVVTSIPNMKKLCNCPKILPRCCSGVASATRPMLTGFREARKKPHIARRKTRGSIEDTRDMTVTAEPTPMQPHDRMVRRDSTCRSARIPQKGAAKLAKIIWAVVRMAISWRVSSMSLCKAKRQVLRSCESTPSTVYAAARQKNVFLLSALFASACTPGVSC
mmetsp:Transcript_28556/g.67874  ORF Transcript_28556/g.67874 Transcript_28556/m.67874 type:complete len:254 (-) Transcript_28556:150-911(-)